MDKLRKRTSAAQEQNEGETNNKQFLFPDKITAI